MSLPLAVQLVSRYFPDVVYRQVPDPDGNYCPWVVEGVTDIEKSEEAFAHLDSILEEWIEMCDRGETSDLPIVFDVAFR